MLTLSSTGYGLQDIYKSAIEELKLRKERGGLNEADYYTITNCSNLDDVLSQFQSLAQEHLDGPGNQKIRKIGESLVNRLERFGVAIDMIVQSMPEIAGINLVGVIWGTFRLLLVVARDLSSTLNDMVDLCDQLVAALPRVEIYVQLFASSDVQLLKAPLTHLYAEIMRFGLLATKHFNRSLARNLWYSIWSSMNNEFQDCIKQIERASKEVDTAAQVQHMHQTNEEVKNQQQEHEEAERFRQDARLFFTHVRNAPTKPLPPTQQATRINDTPQYLLSPTFTGRSAELSHIQTLLSSASSSPTICAIYGMSGLGKTQLALKYAAFSYEQHEYSCIFWLHASTTQKLYQSLTNILNLINHPDRYHPDGSARLTMTRLWLEKFGLDTNGVDKWLIVVDDASTSALPFLRENLPRTNPHGRILITTQSEVAAKALVNKRDCIMQLSVPSPEDAAAMFLEEARKEASEALEAEKGEIENLVKSVGCLPLAVSHAAGFMTSSRMKLSDILDLYRSEQKMEVSITTFWIPVHDTNMLELLTWDNKLSTYEEKSVAATFKRKFDYLNEQYPVAGDLLKLLSFFDPEKIQIDILISGTKIWEEERKAPKLVPETSISAEKLEKTGLRKRFKSLLRSTRHDPEPQTPKKEEPKPQQPNPLLTSLSTSILSSPALHKALSHLQDHSLIMPLNTSTTLSVQMHDLVRFMIQKSDIPLSSKKHLLTYATSIVCNVFRSIPDPTAPQYWSKCEAVVPHIVALEKLTRSEREEKERNIEILNDLVWANTKMAEFFRSRGLYSEAESCYDRAHFTGNMSAKPFRGLADVLVKQGRYSEAEKTCLRGLNLDVDAAANISKINAKALSPEALGTAAELVNVYDKQARYTLAITLGETILSELHTRPGFGVTHPDTLQTMHNMGLAYGHSAQYTKAEDLLKRVLGAHEKNPAFGPDHPETLRSVNALANLYDRKGQHEDATKLYMRAISGREKLFGLDHSQTLKSVCGLANLWMRRDMLDDAKMLYLRALDANEKRDRAPNPDLLRAVHGYAAVLMNQEEFEAAIKQYERAVKGRMDVLGEKHADTLRSIEGLAITYLYVGKMEAAKGLFERVLMGRKKVLGEEHPETLQAIQQLELFKEMNEHERNGIQE